MQKPLRCILIGETSLLIQCARILRNKGLEIVGVISPDENILSWAETERVAIHRGYRRSADFLHRVETDYLLSIVNSAILSRGHLQHAKIAAINYHDSPLPRYAGVYATTWALMNGETRHGITWHLMTETADEGDILIQASVAIDPRDTVQTLNARCYEQAIRSFSQLADRLARAELDPQPQDLGQRTYTGLYQRPEHACFLRFNRPTSELVDLVRALTYDRQYKNPFATPKLLIDRTAYSVAAVQPGRSDQPSMAPGTLVQLDDEGLCVATADGFLRVELTDSAGTRQSAAMLQSNHDLDSGTVLPVPDPALLVCLSEWMSRLSRHESFWERTIEAFVAGTEAALPEPARRAERSEAWVPFSRPLEDERLPDLLAALHLLFCSLHLETPRIGLCHDACFQEGPAIAAFIVPFVLDWSDAATSADVFVKSARVKKLIEKETFLTDLLIRSPRLPESAPLNYDYIINFGRDRREALLEQQPQAQVLHIDGQGVGYAGRTSEFSCTRFLQRCLWFWEQVADDPEKRLESVRLRLSEEILADDAIQGRPEPGDHKLPVHRVIARQAARHPGQTAVIQGQTHWSYAELERKSDAVAGALCRSGAGKIVAVCLARSPELIAVLLGILKAGAAYLPLSPDTPRRRMEAIVADAGVEVMICSDSVEVNGCTCLSPQVLFEPHTGTVCNPADGLDTPAYIIYTSGSTGTPKGVVVGHRSLAGFVHDCVRRYRIAAADRVLQFASVTFDAAVEEIFPSLCAGAALVLRDDEVIGSVPRFVRFCGENRLTILDLPTAFWNLLNSECERLDLRLPESIRLVIIGGETATEAMFALWNRRYGYVPELVNTYGPTETTVVATAFTCTPQWQEPFLPIGLPVAHVETFCMNARGQVLPRGYVGELVIGGTCLALEYLNRIEQTRDAFRHETIETRRIRVYRSGDLVRRLADGNLVFVGRKDMQVKIRGFRVELEEIKSALVSLDGVRDATVAIYGRENEKKVAAYVVFDALARTTRELRDELAATLPDYMLPTVVVPMDRIPLTVNMKVDSRVLPDPADYEPAQTVTVHEPVTPVEERLIQIWKSVLKRETIAPDQDFFELGGDSLLAVGLMTEIETQLQKSLPISVLFQHGTVRLLAGLIESGDDQKEWRSLVTIKKGEGKPPLFIIHGAGLNVLLFNTLAEHMDAGQPVYGLQAGRLLDERPESIGLADIVQAYAREISDVAGSGPYAVAGFSIGGFIAFEAARYLASQGKPVVFCGIFDTYMDQSKARQTGFAAVLQPFKKIGFALQLTLTRPRESLPLRWRWLRFRLGSLFHSRQNRAFDPDLAHLPEHIAVPATVVIKAVERHRFAPYDGCIHLFRATRRLFYVQDKEYMGWKTYTREIKVFDIPGDHSYIFAPPNNIDFARTLQQALDQEVEQFFGTRSA